MKILCVEDGSVDINKLEEEPLRDGKVLVYRRGSTPPYVLEVIGTNEIAIRELRKVQTQLVRNRRKKCLDYVSNRIKELGGEDV